jgi:hypothetical protein
MAPTAAALLETLFDFSDPAHVEAWTSIGDAVMGGVSSGALALGAGGVAAFAGTLSFDRGGGFASIRSSPGVFDLSSFGGVLLEVRGDGRTYTLSLRTDPWFDGVSHQARFATRAGEPLAHRIPFSSFRPTWRGRPVPGAPLLEPARIRSFGILLRDGPAGPFRLEIAAIRAYR